MGSTIPPTTLPAGTVGTAYNQTLTASGGSGTVNLTYQFGTGSLPAGLNISQNSSNTLTIEGTPTAAGTVVIQMTGSDSAGDTQTQDETLTVNAANALPTITPTTIPSGTVGTAYNQTITASGGSGTLTVGTDLTPSLLPAGLISTLTGNTLTISGTPTAAGNANFTVTATDAAGDKASQTYRLTVIPACTGVSVVIPQPVSTTEGQDFKGSVATFTAANTNAKADDFTAFISWGDVAVSTGDIQAQNGGFTITGDHAYAEEGTYVIAITVTENSSGDTTPTATAATVADAALKATSNNLNATEGAVFTGTVASFTDANSKAQASDFTAQITWGDGHVSAGTVAANGNQFTVTGNNTYAEEGSDPVTVQITDKGGSKATTNSTLTVADAPLKATGAATIAGQANVAIPNATVATFTKG